MLNLEWKRKSSYSLLTDTLYHAYPLVTERKQAGLGSLIAAIKSIPKKITQRASNVEGLKEYADDILLAQKPMTKKVKMKKLDELIEEATKSFNKGETEMLTLQTLLREQEALGRPGTEKLLAAIKEIASEKPLATALTVGGVGGLTANRLGGRSYG